MSEKLLYEIEMAFLKQIYEHKGAIGVNELLHIFQSSYGLKEDIFNRILGVVMQKEYCIIEKIRKLDNTEEEVIFVTYKGLEKFLEKKKFSVKNLLKNKIAYELKCEGYKTYSDWNVGVAKPIEHSELVQHRGILYVTNQRIVFQASEKGFDKTYGIFGKVGDVVWTNQ